VIVAQYWRSQFFCCYPLTTLIYYKQCYRIYGLTDFRGRSDNLKDTHLTFKEIATFPLVTNEALMGLL